MARRSSSVSLRLGSNQRGANNLTGQSRSVESVPLRFGAARRPVVLMQCLENVERAELQRGVIHLGSVVGPDDLQLG